MIYTFRLVGALCLIIGLSSRVGAVAIPVTYQQTSWITDGVPVIVSTPTTNDPGRQRIQSNTSRIPTQSFTAPSDFTLDKIWIKYQGFQPGSNAYTIDLRLFAMPNANDMYLPVSPVNLFSQPQTHSIPATGPNNANGNYAIFDVENIALQSGKAYAFQFFVTGTSANGYAYEWWGFNSSTYSGGTYLRPERDPNNQLFDQVFALQQLIITQPAPAVAPEPATSAIALLAAAIIPLRRRPTRQ